VGESGRKKMPWGNILRGRGGETSQFKKDRGLDQSAEKKGGGE